MDSRDEEIAFWQSELGQGKGRHEEARRWLRKLGVKPSVPDALREAAVADQQRANPSFVGEVGQRLGELGRGFKALGTAAAHPVDTFTDAPKRRQLLRGVDDAVTLGYGQKLADRVTRGISDPLAERDYEEIEGTLSSTEAADQEAAPDFRTGGAIAGSFMPGATRGAAVAGSTAAKAALPGAGVGRNVVRSVAGYQATAPATAFLHAGNEGRRGEAAGEAAIDPVGVGLSMAAGAAGQVVKNAPARAAESELAGLKEGVQYRTRVTKVVPNEADLRVELNREPQIRGLIKTDPVKARQLVDDKFAMIADTELQGFYNDLVQTGRDGIPGNMLTKQLQDVRKGFNRVTEKGQIAAVDDMIQEFQAIADENGGTVPAQFVREASTSLQGQGHASVPMVGQVPLTKQMKQAVGGALRGVIAEHMEAQFGGPTRDAFRAANKRVSTWARIKEVVDEKADRLEGNARPAGDFFNAAADVARHPLKTAVKIAAPVADAVDRRILGPVVGSRAGQAVAPAAGAVSQRLPLIPALSRAAQNDERRKRESRVK